MTWCAPRTSSSGTRGHAADRVSELGLRLAVFSPDTRAKLDEHLFPRQAGNPVDLGGRRVPEGGEISSDVTRILLEDPDVAYGLVILTSMPSFAARTKMIGEVAQAADKPVMITLTPGAAADAPRQALRDIGQVYFDRVEDALRVLALVAEHDQLRAAPAPAPARPANLPDARALG